MNALLKKKPAKKATTKKVEAKKKPAKATSTAPKTRVERAYNVLTRPIVNEKTTLLSEQGKLVFLVAPDASKTEIKKATESLFGTKVKSVNTIVQQGKVKRFRGIFGKRKDYKKAIITLEKGENIELLTGAKGN